MCGIAGIFDPAGRLPSAETAAIVGRMVRVMKYRGPDDDGVHVDAHVGLGSARLSILDLSPAGHMPMRDPVSGLWIIHNGEIYNYKEIRAELGEDNFRTGTDTEVVLKAYARWGEACLERFNGIFAFAVWDPRRRRLFCARDRLGVKPLFYGWHQGRLVFGSEIKCLLAAGMERAPDLAVLNDYLAHGLYDHGSATFFANISQVPPAHTLTVDPDGARIAPYWRLDDPPGWNADPGCRDTRAYETAVGDFLDLAADALRLQLRSDVPIAVHISGGIDSTFMVGLINRINGGQGDLRAFSYYFGEERYDERPEAETLAAAAGWSAEYHRVDAVEVPGLAAEAMYFQEQPFPGLVTLAKHKLIKASRSFGAKVILEGQGGDEIGAGYQYVLGAHLLDLIRDGHPGLAADEIAAFARLNGIDPEVGLRKALNGLAALYHPGWSADGTRAARPELLADAMASSGASEPAFPTEFRSNLLTMQHRDLFHTKLPRILRSCDRASMARGCELRVPLLDHRLVEFAFSLPSSYKISRGEQRRFLRDATRRIFPVPHVDKPKRAVVDPQREWLRGPLAGWVEDVISSERFRTRGIFDIPRVKSAFDVYKSTAGEINSVSVWQWLSIDMWFRSFIEADPLAQT